MATSNATDTVGASWTFEISLVPVLIYILKTTFAEGYLDALGLPPEIAGPPPLSMSTGFSVALSLAVVVALLSKAIFVPCMEVKSKVGLLVSRTVAAASAALLYGLVFFVVTRHLPQGGVVTALLAAAGAGILAWWQPLFLVTSTPSPDGKWQRFIRGTHDAVARLLGPKGPFVVSAIIIAAFLGERVGAITALTRPSWVQVEHEKLQRRGFERWVLISEAGDKIWAAPVRQGEIVAQLVAVDSVGATLQRMPAPSPRPRVARGP